MFHGSIVTDRHEAPGARTAIIDTGTACAAVEGRSGRLPGAGRDGVMRFEFLGMPVLMDESMIEALATCPEARSHWVHDLRNAVNVLGTGLALSHRLLEKGRPDDAKATLADAMRGIQRAQALLGHAEAATRLGDGSIAGPLAESSGPRVPLNS